MGALGLGKYQSSAGPWDMCTPAEVLSQHLRVAGGHTAIVLL